MAWAGQLTVIVAVDGLDGRRGPGRRHGRPGLVPLSEFDYELFLMSGDLR